MIYIIPLLISFLIYILIEDINLIIYGLITLLVLMIGLILNNNIIASAMEPILIFYLGLLILYWLYRSIEDKTLIMLGGLFIIGSYLSIISTSIISLFISIEILSFTIIILINLYIQDQYPGIIYYLLSGLITSIFILSLGYLYLGYVLADKLLFIVLIFKLGLIPFHIILPMIYMNLSINNIFIIDIPYKIILFYILIKLNLILNSFLYIYIIFLLLFSSLASMRYKNLLYILIYSSNFNAALILIIISLKYYEYFIFYILYYSIFVLIYLYLLTNYFINKKIFQSYYLFLWLVLLFNLLGIPPLSGFFIKYYVLSLIIWNNLNILFFFSIISILFISYTYLRILNTILINNDNYKIILVNPNHSNLIAFLITFISFPLLY